MGGSETDKRALLVEDDALVAMVAEDYLRELGFEPVVARNGAEAVECLADGTRFEVALVDVGLPDMRGDDLADRIRGDMPELPLLIASGYDGGDLSQRFGPDRRFGVLSKPYMLSDLEKALRELGVSF